MLRTLQIGHITAFLEGGAGIAARRLNDSLRSKGISSKLFLGDFSGREDDAICAINWDAGMCRQLLALLRRPGRYASIKLKKRYYLRGTTGYFSLPWRSLPTACGEDMLHCDVLHLHWVARLIDTPSFFHSIPIDKPIVWTLHDMNPFTGGCHHSDDCGSFRTGCGSCPMLRRQNRNDLSRRVFQAKRSVLRDRPIHIVAPSRWMENLARQSPLAESFASIRTIYNGIELNKFVRVDSTALRRSLGIPSNALVVGYGAESLGNKRKGIDEYLAALHRIAKSQRVFGLLFGKDQDTVCDEGLNLRMLGYLSDSADVAEVYSAMDVFVSPTHAEILGQSILESLACQTPVVAFDVGGISESVSHGENGFLARLMDVESLAASVLWLARHPEDARKMGLCGREKVTQQHSRSLAAVSQGSYFL